MATRRLPFLQSRPSLALVLLALLFAVLWLAGGASRADAMGQAVVRGYAWGSLLLFGLFATRPRFGGIRPVLIILLSALCLAMMQLVPLPPEVWRALPGRGVLVEAAAGQAQPWRPWTMTPAATVNALSSLVVPLGTMILAAGLPRSERAWLPALLLTVVTALALIGLLQVSGVIINNPFVNDTIGEVSGTLANRNHFAVLLAIGCPLAATWALAGHARYRLPAALGLIVLLLLTILATGSRAGVLTGLIGTLGAFLLVRDRIRRRFRRAPRWLLPAVVAGTLLLIVTLIGLSVAADRAVSINRIFDVDVGNDMRSRGLPTVLAMIQTYLPFGSGIGGFDPLFRMHEPLSLLKPTYFNHAHNDYLEVALDCGVPGLALLAAVVVWWGRASVTAWTRPSSTSSEARLGSLILAIIMVASAFDYPVRTPIMMAVVVIAGMWLSGFAGENRGSALPETAKHL